MRNAAQKTAFVLYNGNGLWSIFLWRQLATARDQRANRWESTCISHHCGTTEGRPKWGARAAKKGRRQAASGAPRPTEEERQGSRRRPKRRSRAAAAKRRASGETAGRGGAARGREATPPRSAKKARPQTAKAARKEGRRQRRASHKRPKAAPKPPTAKRHLGGEGALRGRCPPATTGAAKRPKGQGSERGTKRAVPPAKRRGSRSRRRSGGRSGRRAYRRMAATEASSQAAFGSGRQSRPERGRVMQLRAAAKRAAVGSFDSRCADRHRMVGVDHRAEARHAAKLPPPCVASGQRSEVPRRSVLRLWRVAQRLTIYLIIGHYSIGEYARKKNRSFDLSYATHQGISIGGCVGVLNGLSPDIP